MDRTPTVRSVCDVSYPANAIFSRMSQPSTKFIRQRCHPCLLGYDPLTHASDMKNAVGIGRVLSLDVSKMDKTLSHPLAERYVHYEPNQFREEEVARDALHGLHCSST